MILRDTPLDTLDRARVTFVKSLHDGIGKPDAGAEFYLAAVSAERKGYELSSDDESLIRMFHSVINKEAYEDTKVQMTGPSSRFNLDQEMGLEQTLAQHGGGVQQQNVGMMLAQNGGQLSDMPSYKEDRVVPPNPALGFSGMQFQMTDGHPDDQYRTHNFIGSDMNPIHGKMHTLVSGFYKKGKDGISQSEKDAHKETRWEDHVSMDNAADFLVRPYHYGQLDTDNATNHAIYEKHYKDWKHASPSLVEQITDNFAQQGILDDKQIEDALRNLHLSGLEKEWESNLGLMDYLFGMELFSPDERNKAYEHIARHGVSNDNKPLKFDRHDNNPDFIPRLIRNFHQRFSGLYNHWIRNPKGPGEPTKNIPIRLPEEAENIKTIHNYNAMTNHQPFGKKNSYERAVDYYNKMLPLLLDEGDDSSYRLSYSEVPSLYTNEAGDIEELGVKPIEERVPTGEKDHAGKPVYTTRHNHPNFRLMNLLLNIDKDGKLYEDEQHPLWGMSWNNKDSPFSQDEIDEILKEREKQALQEEGAARTARTHGIFHYGSFVDENDYDYTDDSETLATYWQRPFFKGGLGKHANELFNLLHHHTLLFNPEFAEQEEEADPRGSIDLSDYYPEGMIEEEEKKDEKTPTGYTPRISTDGKRRESLLFGKTKSGNNIDIRHNVSGSQLINSMLPLLGPFAHPNQNLFQLMEKGKVKNMNVRGDVQDASMNMSPYNAFHSSSKKGISGENRQVSRHTASSDGAFVNQQNRIRHDARERGDDATAHLARSKLNGKVANHLTTVNPFSLKQKNPFSQHGFRTINSHIYHDIGKRLGFSQAPMMPYPSALQPKDARTSNTLHFDEDHDRTLDKEPFIPLADYDNAIDQVESDYSQALLNLERGRQERKRRFGRNIRPVQQGQEEFESPRRAQFDKDSEKYKDTKKLIEEEYKRRLARIESKFQMKNTPAGSIRMGTQSIEVPSIMLKPVLSAPQPEQGEEGIGEDYANLVSNHSRLSDILENENLSPDERKGISRQISEIDERLDAMEATDRPEDTGQHTYGGSGHSNTLHTKIDADTKAIAQSGQHLQKRLSPEEMAHIFDPTLPHETVAANIRMFAMFANDFLQMAPHESHGIQTQGNTVYTEQGNQPQAEVGKGIKGLVRRAGTPIDLEGLFEEGDENAVSQLMDVLGYDKKNPQLRQTAINYMQYLANQRAGKSFAPIMTVRQVFESMYPDIDVDEVLSKTKKAHGAAKRDPESVSKIKNLFSSLGSEQTRKQLGLDIHMAHSTDDRHPKDTFTTKPSRFGNATRKRHRSADRYHNLVQKLNSIVTELPEVEAAKETFEEKSGLNTVPVDRFNHDSHTVNSYYNSSGFRHEFGHLMFPNFDYDISPNGETSIKLIPEGHPQRLVPPLHNFWQAISPPEWMNMLQSQDPMHVNARAMMNTPDRLGPQFIQNSVGRRPNKDIHSTTKSMGLADLTNPDLIRKDLGPEVPILQPMHRIFEISDLEHLRGFSGDWVVSHMPEGQRGFVKKEDDKVESETFALSDEDKKNFKEVTDEDFNADVIKLEDGYYIFDVIEFAGKEVHEVPISDRIKILRGGMEGIQNVHLPSASDTRLTDDAGLASTIKDLKKEHDSLLLRDAKSVYMAGELRHPKWVMLKPGQDVVLRVLERRGNGPYTYRLGTGPITQDESIGNRAVESDGETYMDVGAAFNSPEKYNEGDHVRVNVTNVSKVESAEDNNVYTLTGSEIVGEAEGEGLVSQETLGMLAKSEDAQWLCEVHRAKSGIRVVMPQGDVVYKATESGEHWTVHSPLSSNGYLIRLSESQRMYWSPIAGALLKADVEIKEEVHESQGDAKPLIPPKKVQDAEWWKKKEKQKVLVKGLSLVDKFLKSSIGAVGAANAGAKGLGLDYATPIESPMGPTNLHDEKTMPDYDNRKRPGEDYTIPEKEEDEEPDKHMVIPVENGTLEIDSEKAIVRIN